MRPPNIIKAKLAQGQKVCGAFVSLNTTASIEILALAGLDFVIIDTEHGPFGIEKTLELILAAEARCIAPLVRVHEIQRSAILKALDAGAMGLLIPALNTVAEARQLVAWGKYRPLGDRGYGFSRAASYGHGAIAAGGIAEYFAKTNAETLLLPQCETASCLNQIEEIVAVPGIDGIFIGPFDLSVSLGIAQQFSHPLFLAACERVLQACRTAGKLCFILATAAREVEQRLAMGYDGIVSTDVGFLQRGVSEYVDGVKRLTGQQGLRHGC